MRRVRVALLVVLGIACLAIPSFASAQRTADGSAHSAKKTRSLQSAKTAKDNFITSFKVTPSAYGVRIDVATASATIARVAYGVGQPIIWTAPDGPSTTHTFKIHALTPATTYTALVTVTPLTGNPLSQTVNFTTSSFPTHPIASTAWGDVTMNGEPFFPIYSLGTCPWDAQDDYNAGVNVIINAGPDQCKDKGLASQVNWIGHNSFSVGAYDPGLSNASGVVGWYIADEPDGHGIPPSQLPQVPWSPSKLRIITLTEHFTGNNLFPWNTIADINAYMGMADVIGFDSYPLQGKCDRAFLGTVYDYEQSLVAAAGAKPTFEWIEVGGMEKCAGDPNLQVTPQVVHNEVWQSIAAGAHGLGIFPASDISSDNINQLTHDTNEIAALSPALLSPVVPVKVDLTAGAPLGTNGFIPDGGGPIHASARIYNGATYIIVTNAGFTPAAATITLPGLGNSTLNTYDGPAGTVQASSDAFNVSLEPLGVRIYVVQPDDLG